MIYTMTKTRKSEVVRLGKSNYWIEKIVRLSHESFYNVAEAYKKDRAPYPLILISYSIIVIHTTSKSTMYYY